MHQRFPTGSCFSAVAAIVVAMESFVISSLQAAAMCVTPLATDLAMGIGALYLGKALGFRV